MTGAILFANPANEGTFWFPPQASTGAEAVDFAYNFIYWVSVVSFVVVVSLMCFFALRYRRRARGELPPERTASHNTVLEVGWSIPVALTGGILFYLGAVSFLDSRSPPSDAYEISVKAMKWAWSFTYPNGHTSPNLHAPSGRPVRLVMSSDDILHSLYIPAFRLKQDVVPGRYTEVWFEATEPGEYQIFCTEYCGTKHSEMLAKAVIQTPEAFTRWLDEASNILDRLPPDEAGKQIFSARGCVACHSVDGRAGVGPSLLGIFGKTQKFVDGTTTVADENYIRSSILNPASQVVEGFNPVMPSFQGSLKDKEIDAIIAYIKTLK
ncbi:MAG: cytochrome c oxidase subunit II [Deltaproteobacteria bacterium]|nr:cytochrome c oxidase subunit II [Deltaproteobacteria bacterium]